MKSKRMWKDDTSNTGNCPSLNRVTDGPEGYIVVGKNVDAETRAQVPEIGPGETAVFVPANVLDRLRQDLPEGGPGTAGLASDPEIVTLRAS